jgi:hypothetical protein
MKTLAQKGIIRIACTVRIGIACSLELNNLRNVCYRVHFLGYFSRQRPYGDGRRPLSADGIYRLDANRLHGGDASQSLGRAADSYREVRRV